MGNTARFLHVHLEVAFVSPHHAGNGATRSFPVPGHPYADGELVRTQNYMIIAWHAINEYGLAYVSAVPT